MRRPARVLTCVIAMGLVFGAAACSDPPAVSSTASSTPVATVVTPTTPVTTTSPNPSPSPSPSPTPTPCAATGNAASGADQAARIGGPLSTCGVDVLTGQGRRIRILSVAYSGLEEGSGLPQDEAVATTGCDGWVAPSQTDVNHMAAAGFNSVRLAFSWANLEPRPTPPAADGSLRHIYDQRYLAALDSAVNAVTSRGMALVLDLHQVRWSPAFKDLPVFGHPRGFCQGSGLPAWLYPKGGGLEAMVAAERSFFGGSDPDAVQGMEDAWRFLAGRYASNPLVIGADLLNEPYDLLTAPYPDVSDLSPADLDLAGFYERMGEAVHEAAPAWLLFVEENISRRTGRFALIRKPELTNMVLAPHFYQATWDQVGIDRLERYLEKSRTWDVPLWLGETTRFALDPGWASSLTHNLDWYTDHEAGWALWSYQPGWFDGSVQPGMVEVVRGGF